MRTIRFFRRTVPLASAGVSLVVASVAGAATRQAGPGQTYATPCAAIAVALPNDEIDVAPGTYTDSCEIKVAGLTVKGVGGQPKIDVSGTDHPADYEGIFVISADDVRIENLELTGAHVDDAHGSNGAALRVTGHGLVVHGCNIHDNQDGVLAAPIVDGGTITIEYTELSHNGLGDGCDTGGCVHNVYISKNNAIRYDKTIFQFNWSHDLASDTANKGHLFKSRSRETDVLYNRITGEAGHDSYEVDIPNAGLGIVVGNVIEKGPDADNAILLDYGEEGIDPGQQTALYVVNNTFVNDFTASTFIKVASGATLVAHDDIFAGPGTPASTGALSADNLSGANPMFIDPSMSDYHLMAGSPAIGKGVDPGSAGGQSLTPTFEYVQPLLSVARLVAKDLGAFEYGTSTSNAGTDAGVASGAGGVDGGVAAQGDAGTAGDDGEPGGGLTTVGDDSGAGVGEGRGDAGSTGSPGAASGGGCGCRVGPGSGGHDVTLGIGALALSLPLLRRRRR